MVFRGKCILLAELRSRKIYSSVENTVSILHPALSSKYKLPELTKAVKTMFDMGSRYKNIEKTLGAGSWLVLGKANAETTWTKLIRKSGADFSRVMDYMQELGLPSLASDYKDLSAKLMEHEVNHYIRGAENFRAQGPATLTPMPVSMPDSNDPVSPDPMGVESQDDGDSPVSGSGGPGDILFSSDEEGFLHLP